MYNPSCTFDGIINVTFDVNSLSPLIIFHNWCTHMTICRGSSDEADTGARRSTQSTPRMSRSRIRSAGDYNSATGRHHNPQLLHHQQQTPSPSQQNTQQHKTHQQRNFGSLGSMEVHRVNPNR